MCEPVCRTSSPAQHPASRSYDNPLGFNRLEEKIWIGNMLAFRCLAICWFAWRHFLPTLLEQPLLSKMAWLPMWKYLLTIGFAEAHTDSCAFGCIHRKPFRFLGSGLAIDDFNIRCPGGHQHVRIEGKFTKPSAIYHPGLAKFIATKFYEALASSTSTDLQAEVKIESVICNDVLTAFERHVSYINILESRSIVELLRTLVLKGGDRRSFILADSRVAKGAHAKGRSSARALKPALVRACTYSIAGNIHSSFGFAPTRLNPADALTRDRELELPTRHSILDFLSHEQIAVLHSYQFSRATAGWIRLFILLSFCLCPGKSCDAFGLQPPCHFGLFHILLSAARLCANSPSGLITCVFRGFGFVISSITFVVAWIFCLRFILSLGTSNRPLNKFWVNPILAAIFTPLFEPAAAMPLSPQGHEETARAVRRSGVKLQADRIVLESTRDRRRMLLDAFDEWLVESWNTNLDTSANLDCEAVTDALVSYGKDLYDAGKSYGKFSETINAVTQRRPVLRRRVAAAWDLAFNWIVDEPHEHHTALLLSIMLASVTLSLLWGWCREAALIALMWCGVLRVGEALTARRSDLVLPCDAAPGVFFLQCWKSNFPRPGEGLLNTRVPALIPLTLWACSPSPSRIYLVMNLCGPFLHPLWERDSQPCNLHLAWSLTQKGFGHTRWALWDQVEPHTGCKLQKTLSLWDAKGVGSRQRCLKYTYKKRRLLRTSRKCLQRPKAEFLRFVGNFLQRCRKPSFSRRAKSLRPSGPGFGDAGNLGGVAFQLWV